MQFSCFEGPTNGHSVLNELGIVLIAGVGESSTSTGRVCAESIEPKVILLQFNHLVSRGSKSRLSSANGFHS